VNHNSFLRRDRVAQSRCKCCRMFDTYATQAEAARDGGEIGRTEAQQLGWIARLVALHAQQVRPTLAEAGVVVDHDGDGNAAPSRSLQFGQVVVESAVA